LVLVAAVGCSAGAAQRRVAPTIPAHAADTVAQPPLHSQPIASTLQFSELLAQRGTLRASERVASLAGQRVRMVGFMAELEHAPHGAFYLTARPVSCDEAGAGTGDLPIENVFVLAPFVAAEVVPHVDGAVEIVGRLEVGNQVDADGFPSSFRIHLDAPAR
jgi:hypothetical protein